MGRQIHPTVGIRSGFTLGSITTVTDSHVYKHAPLAMVLLEVRHPEALPLTRGDVAALEAQLVKFAPLHKTDEIVEAGFSIGPTGAHPGPSKTRVLDRFIARDRRTNVNIGTDLLTVETTAYPGWERFRELLAASLTARNDIAPVAGFSRIGLRYIDEIRVPTDGGAPDWQDWVDRTLLGPDLTSVAALRPTQHQVVMQYATAQPSETITLRYGAVDAEPAVRSSDVLVRPNLPGRGHFFLIDIDAAWSTPEDEPTPEFSPDGLLEVADRLHAPVKAIFESLITEKLREEVLDAD